MSDERADAIPEAAVEAALNATDGFGAPITTSAIKVALAAAAPHMAGSGEAEAVRRELSEAGILNPGEPLGSQVWRLRVRADVAMAEVERLRAAQPDAERAPQAERCQHDGDYCPECGQGITYEAVAERAPQARAILNDVMRWLSQGDFSGWEQVVADVNARLRAAQPDAERCRRCGSQTRLAHCEGSAYNGPCDMQPDAERAPQPEPRQDEQ